MNVEARDVRGVVHAPGVDRVLELVAVFTLAMSVIGLGAALAGWFHAPQVLLAALLATGAYARKIRHADASLDAASPRWWHVLLLVTLALAFRLPAYNYVLGGQDEGLYTNIAQHVGHTGALSTDDRVMRNLVDTPYLGRYLADNRIPATDVSPVLFLPGIYAPDASKPRLAFQFYFLFPVWMAVVGGLFGAVNAVYALTFLSVLSIVFFYRLALILTRSASAGLMAGSLLALNPLHAFFSKFPLTEVPALAFALIGFTYFASSWSNAATGCARRRLWLSVSAFLCLFVTRISGLMYVPIFIAAAMAALAADDDRARARHVQTWVLCVALAYLASVAYGLHWSGYYSTYQYRTTLGAMFGPHWKPIVGAIIVAGLLVWASVAVAVRRPGTRCLLAKRVVTLADGALGWAVATAVVVALVKIYLLAWTAHYSLSPMAVRFDVAGHGWRSVGASTLWTLVVFLGPLLIAFLWLVVRRQRDPRMAFLRWFAAAFFAFSVVSQWVTFYSPYYARYVLSETLPYALLFVACVWVRMPQGRGRAALSAALGLTLIYSAGASALQVGKSEDAGARAPLARLVAPVEPDDVILLDTKERPPETSLIKTPMVYTFHCNVVTVGPAALADPGYLAVLNSRYPDVFLATTNPAPPRGFVYVTSARFAPLMFRHSHFLPRALVPRVDAHINLYRLAYPQAPVGAVLSFAMAQPWTRWLQDGWSTPEGWGTWSDADHATLSIDPRQLPATSRVTGAGPMLDLTLHANVFVSQKHPTQRIRVVVDGGPVAYYEVTYPAGSVTMTIPIPPRSSPDAHAPIQVQFDLPDAVSPAQVGVGGDERLLGLGLIDAVISSPRVSGASAPLPLR